MSAVFVHLLHFPVYSLGPGRRVGLWFQGCTRHCDGCVTPQSWSFDPRNSMLLSDLVGRLKFFFDAIPEPDGLTVSGGEPFDQPDALIKILRSVKDMGVDDILIYSGYRVETLLDRHPELPELAGALVDGPFENGNDTECVWKGSDNQSLTLWRGELSARYEEWTSGATRKLQWVKNGCQSLLVGIPRQGDVGRLRNPYG